MLKIKDLISVMIIGALLFGVGVWVGQSDTSIVHAQGLKAWAEDESQGGAPYRYQLVNGNTSQRNTAYALRLDRKTGRLTSGHWAQKWYGTQCLRRSLITVASGRIFQDTFFTVRRGKVDDIRNRLGSKPRGTKCTDRHRSS